MKRVQHCLVALLVAGTLSLGLAGTAATQDVVVQDGLVNVAIGDIELLENVQVADAADIIIQACDLNVNAVVGVLARVANVDRTGRDRTFCTAEEGDITVTQNTGA